MLFKYFTQWEIRRTFSILYKVFEKYRKVSKHFHYKRFEFEDFTLRNFVIVWRDFKSVGILRVEGFWNWRILDDGILSGRILRLTGYWAARFLGLTGYWARRNFWEWRNIKGGIFEIDEILSATGFLKLTGYWVAGFWEWRDIERGILFLRLTGYWDYGILSDGILSGEVLRSKGFLVTGFWNRRNFEGRYFEIDGIVKGEISRLSDRILSGGILRSEGFLKYIRKKSRFLIWIFVV